MNRIQINGKYFETKGTNISVQGSSIFVDGELIKNGLSGEIHITFDGPLANLSTTGGSTVVNGDVHGNIKAAGSIKCKNVGNSVSANGSVKCLNVEGDIRAGGSVQYCNK